MRWIRVRSVTAGVGRRNQANECNRVEGGKDAFRLLLFSALTALWVVYWLDHLREECAVSRSATVQGAVCRRPDSSHDVSIARCSCRACQVRLSMLWAVKWARRTCLIDVLRIKERTQST